MKTWSLAAKMEVCGYCIAFIERGQPMLLIQIPGVVSKKVRCARLRCAGEPPPADIPTDVEIEVQEPVRWQIASLPFDFKTAQSGE